MGLKDINQEAIIGIREIKNTNSVPVIEFINEEDFLKFMQLHHLSVIYRQDNRYFLLSDNEIGVWEE